MTQTEKQKLNEQRIRKEQIFRAGQPSKFNILAFDQAAKCGVAWQFAGETEIHYEMWDVSVSAKTKRLGKQELFHEVVKATTDKTKQRRWKKGDVVKDKVIAKDWDYHKYSSFDNRLREFLAKHPQFQYVGYEGIQGKSQIVKNSSAGFRAIICKGDDYKTIELPITSVKKFATGKGKVDDRASGKLEMIQACKELWGIETEDDNIADAVHLLMYLKSIINHKFNQ